MVMLHVTMKSLILSLQNDKWKVQLLQWDHNGPDSAKLFKTWTFKKSVFQQYYMEAKSKGKTH